MKELRGEREKRADGRRFRRTVAKKRKPRATRGLVRGIDDDTPSRHTEYIYIVYMRRITAIAFIILAMQTTLIGMRCLLEFKGDV